MPDRPPLSTQSCHRGWPPRPQSRLCHSCVEWHQVTRMGTSLASMEVLIREGSVVFTSAFRPISLQNSTSSSQKGMKSLASSLFQIFQLKGRPEGDSR